MAPPVLPLKMNLALPFSANSKTRIKICSSSSKSFPITQSLSFAPRTRNPKNHDYPSLISLLKLNISKSEGGRRTNHAVVRTSQNETGEPEQKEAAETESKEKIIVNPVWPRGERFKEEFLSKIVPWEKITVDDTKSLLVDCVASHLKQNKFRKYGGDLKYSSNRIQLQSIPGTDLCRERLVSAVARELQVPLLRLDSSVLPPYDIGQYNTKLDSDEDGDDSDEEEEEESCYCDEDENGDEDDSDEEEGDTSTKPKVAKRIKKGDRVIYVGDSTPIKEMSNRKLPKGNRGELYEVNGERMAVLFNDCGLERMKEEEEKSTEKTRQIVTWLDAKDVKHEDNALVHDCFIAMEFLYEVLESGPPVIAYFPDSFFSSITTEASWRDRSYFFDKAKKMFEKLSGRVVLIYGQNKTGSKEIEKFPDSMKKYIMKLNEARLEKYEMDMLFTNKICIKPPKDENWEAFIKQIEEDKKTVIAQGNLGEMHSVMKAHRLLCKDLEQANTTDMILKRWEVEKIVSWATSHYLSSCSHPCVEEELLHIPHQILKLTISRLEEQRKTSPSSKGSTKRNIKVVMRKKLVSAVVCAEDIGVKFDDVGALEHVKKTLFETVILPLTRPELFSHGSLTQPCKGVLLFGPPGTGKTLMAKALATEAGANFINVTTATLTSKWVGETERLTRALFSLARKLSPAIIFVDEVDSMFGARGHNKYDTSRLNEFMAAWDGFISKDSQRILVMGATNRPFDLDDAVLRRMPRRVYVELPDAENRSKILKILLSKDNLEPDFPFMELAQATEGYSGDDLKNLCVAAAYRPVHELLERESKGEKYDGAPALRPLNIEDYLLSKSKVRASVCSDASSIQKLREWDMKYGEGGKMSLRLHADGF